MPAWIVWIGPLALYGSSLIALAAAYNDGWNRQIPDRLLIGMVLLWCPVAIWMPATLDAAPVAALGCGMGALVVGYGFFALGWLGGGDGKLLGALALWVGPKDMGLWLLATAAIGAFLALFALLRPEGDFRVRGIPFALAMAPPAAALLVARAIDLGHT